MDGGTIGGTEGGTDGRDSLAKMRDFTNSKKVSQHNAKLKNHSGVTKFWSMYMLDPWMNQNNQVRLCRRCCYSKRL